MPLSITLGTGNEHNSKKFGEYEVRIIPCLYDYLQKFSFIKKCLNKEVKENY